MITGDIVQEKAEITKIHRFEFLSENIVMCIFTLGSKFPYKGAPNDDFPTVTSIFKKINNIWKIHWMQISNGKSFVYCRKKEEKILKLTYRGSIYLK